MAPDEIRNARFSTGFRGYDTTEVRALLAETGPRAVDAPETGPKGHAPLTPESYLGHARMDRFDGTPAIRPDRSQRYSAPDGLPTDHLAYSGTATVQAEHVEAGRDFAIDLAFRGRQVFLVLGADGGAFPVLESLIKAGCRTAIAVAKRI